MNAVRELVVAVIALCATSAVGVESELFVVDTRCIASDVIDTSAPAQGSVMDISTCFVTDTRDKLQPCDYYCDVVHIVALSEMFECDTGAKWNDSDGDGLPDWWEARYSATGSKLAMLATADDDADGMSNYAEFIANTCPLDAASRFVICGMEVLDGPQVFRLSWNGASGRIYTIWGTQAIGSHWNKMAEANGADGLQSYDIGSDGRDCSCNNKFLKVTVEIQK